MCRLSWNLGASTSWNPQGLSRPVMGLFTFTPQLHWIRSAGEKLIKLLFMLRGAGNASTLTTKHAISPTAHNSTHLSSLIITSDDSSPACTVPTTYQSNVPTDLRNKRTRRSTSSSAAYLEFRHLRRYTLSTGWNLVECPKYCDSPLTAASWRWRHLFRSKLR